MMDLQLMTLVGLLLAIYVLVTAGFVWRAYSLLIIVGIANGWNRLCSLGLSPEERVRRREEAAGFYYEYTLELKSQGYPSEAVARVLLANVVRGVPSDIAWWYSKHPLTFASRWRMCGWFPWLLVVLFSAAVVIYKDLLATAPPMSGGPSPILVMQILVTTVENLQGRMPWGLIGMLLCLTLILPIFSLAHLIARNWVMHAINTWHQFLASPAKVACRCLQQATAFLARHGAWAIETWIVWAQPEKQEFDPSRPGKPSSFHGWELLGWIPHFILLVLCGAADLIFFGLGVTFLLGLPVGAAPGEPVLFGFTLEALLSGLSILLPGLACAAVIASIKRPAADGARPWGNASPEVRRRVVRGCVLAIVIWMGGLAAFAFYRADLMVVEALGVDFIGRQLLVTLPYIFIPIFAFSLATASMLVFWSVLVGLAAIYILMVLGLRRVFEALRWLAHGLVELIDRVDALVIAVWDVCCKSPSHAWNNYAGRKLLGVELQRIHYCDRVPVSLRCQDNLFRSEGEPITVYRCYCTPRPAGAQQQQEPEPQGLQQALTEVA
jgi:hypothetical protein